jgi:hypothetical protein
MYEGMSADEQAAVVSSLGHVLVGIKSGVRGLLSRSHDNPFRLKNIPAVLPQELVRRRARNMLPFVQTHRRRLERMRGSHIVATVELQLKELQRAYRSESGLRAGLDRLETTTSFRESWTMLEGKFPDLVDFVGGLATVFLGTATEESDFSINGCEKDIYKSALAKIYLEGLLHARQFDRLRELPSE